MKILGTIQNELDAVNKQYVDGIIEGYLPLSGGTITATDSWTPLTLKSSWESRSFLRFFDKNDVRLGAIGFSAQGELGWYNEQTGGITRILDASSSLDWYKISNIPAVIESPQFNATHAYQCAGDIVLYRNTADGDTYINRGPALDDNANLYLYARNYIWFMINNEGKAAIHEGNVLDYVKPSFYTKTESDSKYLERKSYYMMPTNSFDNGPKLEVSYLSNALYAADKRFNIEHSGFEAFQGWALANEEYEVASGLVAAGTTATFTISNNGSDIINGYPYGDIYLSFFYTYIPESVTVEVYCNFEPHGIGWHTLNLVETRGETNGVYRFSQIYYGITHIRVTITASATTKAELAEVGWLLNRGRLSDFPAVTKFNIPQTLYGEMTFANIIGGRLATNKESTAHQWKILLGGDNTYLQVGTAAGGSDGNLYLTGINGVPANHISLKAASVETSNHFRVKGALFLETFIQGGENTNIYNIAGIYGRKPTGGTYDKWRIFEYYGGLVFQVASADGLSTAGKLYFQGFNNSPAELIAFKATDISFEGASTFSGAEATFSNKAKVTGAAQTPLSVAATSNVGSFIAFTDVGNGTLGSLGVSADRKPTFITYSGATHELLHKNNLDSCNVSINFYDLSDYHDANLSQAEMNSFGLTTAVINNLKDGKYNKVLDTRDTQVWDYTVDGDKISFKCCDKEVMITKESDGTWYIEFL